MAELRLRAWSPDYDSAGGERGEASGDVDTDVEVPAAAWAPRRPTIGPDRSILVVDGVQRIDAFGELDGVDGPDGGGGPPVPVVFASVGAAAVRAGLGGAVLVDPRLDRVACSAADPGPTDPYRWRVCGATGAALVEAVGRARQELEVAVTAAAAAGLLGGRDELVVVDGPLRGGEHQHGGAVVGYVKSHEVSYLPPGPEAVIAALAPGERTPLFAVASRRQRWSWYARLPGPHQRGWDGIVRGEASSGVSLAEAVTLADRATATLPLYASSPVKDPRAPQNLVPIGGLERLLRHRLGEREVLERRLRRSLG